MTKTADDLIKDMAPLIKTIANAARINDEMGRVVIGQADAARKLQALMLEYEAQQ